jgi:formylmethanofuran dehydrogenase subunit D
MKMKLNTVRLFDHDEAREFTFGDVEKMEEKLAIAFIHPEDFEEMYLVPSLKLHISNESGEIVVKFEQDEDIPKGTILMPVSIWSNQLTSVEEGDIQAKHVEVEVEGSRDPPTKLMELIERIKQ